MENAQKIQSLIGGNPMIKNVLSNPEHMKNAQKMLQSPDVQKQIGGLISNPKVIQQASQVLSGLQQINSTQAGGRKSRRRKRRRRTKKRRRRRRGGIGQMDYENLPEGCKEPYGRDHSLCKLQQGVSPSSLEDLVPPEQLEKEMAQIKDYCETKVGANRPSYCDELIGPVAPVSKGGRKRKRRRTKKKKRRRKSKRRRKRTKKRRRRKSRR
jgi:hypothetical protein